MIEVIQIYKLYNVFGKTDYNSQNIRLFWNVADSFESCTGFIDNDVLYLPLECKSVKGLESARLIFIMDVDGFNSYLDGKDKKYFMYSNDKILTFNQYNKSVPLELFRINKMDSGKFELFLTYDTMLWGVPKRDDHKICEFGIGTPVRYRINGKSDFSMTAGMRRCFYEFDYIFDYLGQVKDVRFLDLSKVKRKKIIPANSVKLVDERKILR